MISYAAFETILALYSADFKSITVMMVKGVYTVSFIADGNIVYSTKGHATLKEAMTALSERCEEWEHDHCIVTSAGS
ncbi:TPA: hypothetical protein DCQ22_03980 [Candidatus Nomurabacteria bacterium]|nr:hypothetical protein [Candidatus Nomurabacteria bacterium]